MSPSDEPTDRVQLRLTEFEQVALQHILERTGRTATEHLRYLLTCSISVEATVFGGPIEPVDSGYGL